MDYYINIASYYGGPAQVQQYAGGTSYQFVGEVPFSVVADGIDVGVPLSLVGNDDGHMYFRVSSLSYLGGNAFSATLDYMPDRGVPYVIVQ